MKADPYQIERHRAQLAEHGALMQLKATYSPKYPEIEDTNTADNWDGLLDVPRQPLREQDPMTQARCRVASAFLPNSAQRILDIGMGHGWLEELLEKRDIELYGCDIAKSAIAQVKKRFKGHFSVQSVYNLRYSSTFDAVFLMEVLEHLPPSRTLEVLANIHTLLAEHGRFILSVPTNEALETMADNPNGHLRMYTVPLISAELELSGFRVLKVQTLWAFGKWYTARTALAHLLQGRWHPNDIVILAEKV